MISLLTKLLKKRGIEKVEDLSKEEREVFDKYKLVLSGELVTIETLKEFCRSQIISIENKCDGINPLTTMQQASLHVYMTLIKAIEAPEAERASLERYLTQLID
jgi:hypothetical protein